MIQIRVTLIYVTAVLVYSRALYTRTTRGSPHSDPTTQSSRNFLKLTVVGT